MMEQPFSKIIAGTMTWGGWGKNYNMPQMIELMDCCLNNGITTFDHADIYGDYTTEASFGLALKESKIDRQKIQLISKCGIQMNLQNRSNAIKHYDYTKPYIIWSVEQSLKNLQTNYLDLLLLHRPSPLMQADEIAEAIAILKKDGKILDFGVSNFTPLQTGFIETKTKVSYNQIEFSLTHFEAMLNGSLDYMQTNKIIPMAWSPMGSIFKKDDEKSDRIKKLATNLAVKYDVPFDIILLAWIIKHPSNILPVCGTADKARITNLMKATSLKMDQDDWFKLWQESSGVEVP